MHYNTMPENKLYFMSSVFFLLLFIFDFTTDRRMWSTAMCEKKYYKNEMKIAFLNPSNLIG